MILLNFKNSISLMRNVSKRKYEHNRYYNIYQRIVRRMT